MAGSRKARSKFWSMHGTHRATGVAYESGHEKKFLEQCFLQGIKVERCTVRVPYIDSAGKARHYEPDFYWPKFDYVIEIKGAWALKSNHAYVKEKLLAAMKHFKGRYTLLTEKELREGFVAKIHLELTRERN